MLLSQTVQLAYKLFLGRLPENETVLKSQMKKRDLDHLRLALGNSAEFRSKVGNWSNYAPAELPSVDRDIYVFQHIPKCGGTSFVVILRRLAEEQNWKMCSERHNGLLNWPLSHLLDCQLFCGHYDTGTLQFLPGRAKTFTLLRQPEDRLLSLYYFLRGHDEPLQRRLEPTNMNLAALANQLNVEDFFSHEDVRKHPSINNGMVAQLSGLVPLKRWESMIPDARFQSEVDRSPLDALEKARRHLESMTAYGFVEDMDRSVRHILAALRLDFSGDVPHVNTSNTSEEGKQNPHIAKVFKDEVTPKAKDALATLTELDQALYDQAFDNWKAPQLSVSSTAD